MERTAYTTKVATLLALALTVLGAGSDYVEPCGHGDGSAEPWQVAYDWQGLPFCAQPSWEQDAQQLLIAIPRHMYQYLHLSQHSTKQHTGVITGRRSTYSTWARGGLAQLAAHRNSNVIQRSCIICTLLNAKRSDHPACATPCGMHTLRREQLHGARSLEGWRQLAADGDLLAFKALEGAALGSAEGSAAHEQATRPLGNSTFVDSVVQRWRRPELEVPFRGYLAGVAVFALSQNGRAAEAEQIGMQALQMRAVHPDGTELHDAGPINPWLHRRLDLNPINPWLHHSYSHAFFYQGEGGDGKALDRAIDTMTTLGSKHDSQGRGLWSDWVGKIHEFMYTHLLWHTAIIYIERAAVRRRANDGTGAMSDIDAARGLLNTILDFGLHMHYEVLNSAVDLVTKAERYLGLSWFQGKSYWTLIAAECKVLMERRNRQYGVVLGWKTGLLKHNCMKALFKEHRESGGESSIWPLSVPQLLTAKGCPKVGVNQPNPSGNFANFGELLSFMQSPQISPCFPSQPLLAAIYSTGDVSAEVLDNAWAATKRIDGASHEQQLGWVEALMAASHIPIVRRVCWISETKQATRRPTSAWDHFEGVQVAPPCKATRSEL